MRHAQYDYARSIVRHVHRPFDIRPPHFLDLAPSVINDKWMRAHGVCSRRSGSRLGLPQQRHNFS
jgi:hypothetical protein